MTYKKSAPHACLLGDVRGSRRTPDRAALHARLGKVLEQVNEARDPVSPLRVTVGDEYQGVFACVGEALAVTLEIRLALLPEHDVRHGVGWGGVGVLEASPRIEDGPGWWAAREAITDVKAAEARAASRNLRTGYAAAEGAAGPEPAAVRAALRLRDEIVSGLSARGLSVLRGLLDGMTQQEIAHREGISASAVSQRVRTDGLAALLDAHDDLASLR